MNRLKRVLERRINSHPNMQLVDGSNGKKWLNNHGITYLEFH